LELNPQEAINVPHLPEPQGNALLIKEGAGDGRALLLDVTIMVFLMTFFQLCACRLHYLISNHLPLLIPLYQTPSH
jgi:hypothetical protein